MGGGGRGKLWPSHTNVCKIPRLCSNVTDFKEFFPAVLTDLGSIFADLFWGYRVLTVSLDCNINPWDI